MTLQEGSTSTGAPAAQSEEGSTEGAKTEAVAVAPDYSKELETLKAELEAKNELLKLASTESSTLKNKLEEYSKAEYDKKLAALETEREEWKNKYSSLEKDIKIKSVASEFKIRPEALDLVKKEIKGNSDEEIKNSLKELTEKYSFLVVDLGSGTSEPKKPVSTGHTVNAVGKSSDVNGFPADFKNWTNMEKRVFYSKNRHLRGIIPD